MDNRNWMHCQSLSNIGAEHYFDSSTMAPNSAAPGRIRRALVLGLAHAGVLEFGRSNRILYITDYYF